MVVGWNDSTATVGTVTDKSGNTYTLAVGPTIQSGVASQSIYYAKNIAAAAGGVKHRYGDFLQSPRRFPTSAFWSTEARIPTTRWT